MDRPFEGRPTATAPAAPPHAPAATAATPSAVVLDLQSVLAAAVGRLEQTIGCESAAAWALRENGEPYVAAACFTGTPPSEPVREVFDALAALRGPADLRDADHPKELRRLAGHLGYSAATPVAAADGTPLAVLLVGVDGRDDPRHTARALAALEAARRRLESPLAAALAMGRLCALDAEVQRLDRLALLGRMASEIAHEIRNPLVSIKTFLQLLPERRNDPEFFARFLDIATEEMRRVERLLDLVIGHARPAQSGGEEGACSVGAVLASVSEFVDHLATKRSIDLTCDAGDALPEVQLADDALRQVILNLALNAIQASPDGGAVRIRARADGAGVAISVRDTGPGVPADARSRIFEPFFTTRSSGAGGLGLAITRRLVDGAGGSVAVTGADGGGAEFRVWLPCAAGDAGA